jgi:hypothetical protein
MSKWPMRCHFRYLHFKTFPMTPRTPQCEVFWALMSNSKHLGVLEDSKSPTLEVLGFTPTLGQSGVATLAFRNHLFHALRLFPCTMSTPTNVWLQVAHLEAHLWVLSICGLMIIMVQKLNCGLKTCLNGC